MHPDLATREEGSGPVGLAYARNADALRNVQPEDVLACDIDAGLGAPWIASGTARIRRRAESATAVEPPADPEPAATPVEISPPVIAAPTRREEPTPAAVIHSFPEMPAAARPQPAYWQQVAHSRRKNDCQMSLFNRRIERIRTRLLHDGVLSI
jgi:hypothetical protein